MHRLKFVFRFSLIMGAAATLAACNEQKAAEPKHPDRPVVTQTVKFEPLQTSRSFVGTIRPRVETDLGFRVTGKVEKRLVDVGDKVRAGQVLAVLDSIDLGLQREQADAELKAAMGSSAQATAEFERVQQLRKQGWSTAAELDRQRAAVDEVTGRVLKAQRAVTLANNAFAYAELKADSDGIVTATMAEPGQVLSSGTPAFRVARSGEKEAVIALPESLVDRARTATATASLWSNAGKSYFARLRELSPSADAATRTYQARFAIANAGQEMDLGMTVTVTLEDQANARIARLPLSSLYNDGHGPSLWTVDVASGALKLKPVDVLAYDAREVLVKSGVSDGDVVVTLGVQKLDAGQKVRVSTTAF